MTRFKFLVQVKVLKKLLTLLTVKRVQVIPFSLNLTSFKVGSNSSLAKPLTPVFSGIRSIKVLCCRSLIHSKDAISFLTRSASPIPRFNKKKRKRCNDAPQAMPMFPSKKNNNNILFCMRADFLLCRPATMI